MHAHLSVVIISHNTRKLTLACLRSVFQRTHVADFEVIVVDNASVDGSAAAIAAEFPGVGLLEPGTNLGFAAGNNFAVRYAKGEYLLLLNPDTELLNDAAGAAIELARSHTQARIVGGRTFFADGSLNPTSCHGRPTGWGMICAAVGLSSLFRNSRWFDPESLGRWQRDTIREVDAVTGCFLLIRRKVWEELGGFDESFFMYGEETDLCIRARKLGYTCMICPEATIIHYGGASEKVRADKMVKLFVAKARLCQKHWSRPAAGFGVRMLDLWALTRVIAHAALAILRPSSRASRATWWQVWQRREQWRRVGKISAATAPPMTEPAAEGATL